METQKNSFFQTIGMIASLLFLSGFAFAQNNSPANSHTITMQGTDANGAPIITTSSEADHNTVNAPDALNLGPASQQYVQNQQKQRKTGRMPETYGFGIGLIALLVTAITAYAIHPGKRSSNP